LIAIAVLPAGASGRTPFRGDWRAVDYDGSNLRLKFVEEARSGGFVFHIEGYDDACFDCPGAPPAEMVGFGILQGDNTIDATTAWWVVPTGDTIWYFLNGPFTYDPVSDTVTDIQGVVYGRSR
jgi:hypothetical protein